MRDRHQAIYTVVRTGVLAVAVGITATFAPRAFAHMRATDGIALVVTFILFILLAYINIPLTPPGTVRRRSSEPNRITLELPLVLTVVTVYGPIVAAALTLVAYPFATADGGRSRFMHRIFEGAPQAILWLFAGGLRSELYPGPIPLSVPTYLAFVAFYVLVIYMFLYGIWIPLRVLATGLSLRRFWRNLSRDSRLMLFMLLLTSWGYVCTVGWSNIGIAFGLASLAPLPFMALTLRSLHENRIELQRLRLARDAVQAMLGAGDPIPQMNSMLEGLYTPAARETLQIYAAITPGEKKVSRLASVGAQPSREQLDLCARALQELNRSDRMAISVSNRNFAVLAHAARTSNDDLLGALIVYRPISSAHLVSRKRMTEAAADLAPMLRDLRSIAATQSAAALDSLTGLPNRRTIMQLLHDRVDGAVLGTPCAVLLLDIDRFKQINDDLGHQTGDKYLRAIANTIARSVRNHDRAGRIGGEEFLVIMPDTTAETAVGIGERLRAAVADAGLVHRDGGTVTVSIGVAVTMPTDSVESLLGRADGGLYRAKRLGRNRVEAG